MSSPNEITATSDLIEKLDYETQRLEVENNRKISDYEHELSNWKRNKDLLIAAKQPVPSKPARPVIRKFDKDRFLEIFVAFHKAVVANIGNSAKLGHFDPSSAWTESEYVSPNENETPEPGLPVPANPIGPVSIGNQYHVAAGYKPTNGEVFEPLGAGGPKFVATVIPGPFGNWQWWTLVRS